MPKETKNFTKAGFADAGLLFVTGLFFLVLALTAVYFLHFGLAPLPKPNTVPNETKAMPAVAALSLPVSSPAQNETTSLDEPQNKDFSAALPETSVKEIFIGSYGAIDKEILEGLRSEVEQIFGVKTTLLNPAAAVPKVEPFYDKSRGHYNSDVLKKSIQQSSEVYGQTARFLYIVDLNMSSFSGEQPEQPRVRNGQNATLVSLYDFRADGKETLMEWAKKAAVRALRTLQ